MNIIPLSSSCREIDLFSSSQYVCTEVIGSCFVVSNFLGRQFPRAAFVPTEWKLLNCHLNVHYRYTSKYLYQKRTWLWVLNPLFNPSTAEWKFNNCRLFKISPSGFHHSALLWLSSFALVPLSTLGGTGSGQSFGRACPSLWLKELLSGFPCCTTNFGYRAVPSLMIFL